VPEDHWPDDVFAIFDVLEPATFADGFRLTPRDRRVHPPWNEACDQAQVRAAGGSARFPQGREP
jgi:hypothetical protein